MTLSSKGTMATDDKDTDEENEERAGPDSGRSPEAPGTYANAGRESEEQTHQQAWDARDDAPGQADPPRAPRDRPQTPRNQPERRYGTNQPSRPSRRYGSKQSISVQNEPVQGQREQEDIRNESEGVQSDERPHGDIPQQGSGLPRGGEQPQDSTHPRDRPPQREDQPEPSRAEEPTESAPPKRTESTPPKRTQPLRDPTESDRETITPDREQTELEVSGGPADEPEHEAEPPTESGRESAVPKYGGPRDWGRDQSDQSSQRDRFAPSGQSVESRQSADPGQFADPGQSVERQRTQREYERRFDKQRARQRDFQRDKSGGKYRRR